MKSIVSDLIELARLVYTDACAKCIADVSDERDLITLRSRVVKEGLSFLTITLPDFANDFERSLANQRIDSMSFRSFRKDKAIPSFLKGMLSQLFDKESGRLYDKDRNCDGNTSGIVECVRQICLTFKKLEIDCRPEMVDNAIASFVTTEHELSEFSLPGSDINDFCHVSDLVWGDAMASISLSNFIPRHGPGATSERVSGNQKFNWKYWFDRLEPFFPLVDSAYTYSALGSEELEKVTIITEDQEFPVRVTPVPKTQKGPRIIAIEPCCMQYAQQAIRSVLYRKIASSKVAGGHVNFRDQSVNQRLALDASRSGQLATIDLSEASDRVPLDLAMRMFDRNPDLRDAILACRSTQAELPSGVKLPLLKFASMGSALCFPIESMYFYTICIVALLRSRDLPITRSNVFYVSREVFVYGDDIIVPVDDAIAVFDYLQKYNCKVNVRKSFVSGNFRESCGMDAYRGYPVTPVYLRKLIPESRRQADRIISWIKTADLFYRKGYWRASAFLYKKCEKHLGVLPYVSDTSPALGRYSFLGFRSANRWNDRFQRLEVRAWVSEPVYRTDKLEGYAALQKSLSTLSGLSDLYEDRDKKHLERSARHGAVALKRRWVPVL